MTDLPIQITEPVGLRNVSEPTPTRHITEPRKSRRITEPFGPSNSRHSESKNVVHVGHPIPQRRQTYCGASVQYEDLQRVQLTVSENFSSEDDDISGQKTWQEVGAVSDLVRFHCQRLYSKAGGRSDLGLFYNRGTFYAMGAWCGHMGGPLFEGDIEDLNGRAHVMCPWHSYMFDLETGKNNLGMKQEIFKVKVEEGLVYVLYDTDLSTTPFNKLE
ncbi:Rieske domain-containing protein-like [Ylistrum balloti]|uniref:Rieske domain-containing protein-like n=1 Tax=Ylistrum balloti TaxID=509963 RepID=UPI002905E8D8|nr:Rieske domain-containing protein-like [Ylistrum balloti]